jgi:hypothetical protein
MLPWSEPSAQCHVQVPCGTCNLKVARANPGACRRRLRLVMMRHAESEDAAHSTARDHDREITAEGRQAAQQVRALLYAMLALSAGTARPPQRWSLMLPL